MLRLKHKYEIYMPDKYADENNNLIALDTEKHLDAIVQTLFTEHITGVSVREEQGYYAHSNGNINKTTNYIICFYTDESFDITAVSNYIKNNMHQETVLTVCDNVAYLK